MVFLIDFDGTLALGDTVDRLLEKHADPAWERLEADWMANRITAMDCMQQQIGLVRADRATLDQFFGAITIDPHFRAFWEYVRADAILAVASDGLEHAVRCALQMQSLGDIPVYANKLEFLPEDRISLSFPHRNEACSGGNGMCKCAVGRSLASKRGGPVVLVGDGKSDACLAARADVVFAKDWLADHCRQQGIAFLPFHDFADVLREVQRWPRPQRVSAA